MERPVLRFAVLATTVLFALALAIVVEQALVSPVLSAMVVPVAAAPVALPGESALKDPSAIAPQGDTPERLAMPEAISRAFVPVPPAPIEPGLLGQITDRRIAGEDRDAFYLAVEANRRTESGGVPAFSALRTTAGLAHRASYGVAQLTVRDHLRELASLDAAELAIVGITAAEIEGMRQRADAAAAWWTVLVERRAVDDAAAVIGQAATDLAGARQLCTAGDRGALIRRYGPSFATGTGIPSGAISDLCATRQLLEPALRAAFAAQYRADHGVSFDPGRRDARLMAATAEHVVGTHRELAASFAQLGGDRRGAQALAHYLGVGDANENLYGWCARAAESALGRDRYVRILTLADPVSSRLRELSNFEHAMAAVSGVIDLRGIERARMVTRIARCFHGAPGRARLSFFFDRDPRRPRSTTAGELEAAIQEHRLSRAWSDARVQSAFDEVLAERRSTERSEP
jgi:hypothetical protein